MKTTYKLLLNLLLLCLFSCDQAVDDLEEATIGTLTLKYEQMPLELVEVSNGRLDEAKANERVSVYIYTEDYFQYAYADDLGEIYTLDMDPGKYNVYVGSTDVSTDN